MLLFAKANIFRNSHKKLRATILSTIAYEERQRVRWTYPSVWIVITNLSQPTSLSSDLPRLQLVPDVNLRPRRLLEQGPSVSLILSSSVDHFSSTLSPERKRPRACRRRDAKVRQHDGVRAGPYTPIRRKAVSSWQTRKSEAEGRKPASGKADGAAVATTTTEYSRICGAPTYNTIYDRVAPYVRACLTYSVAT